MKTTYEYATVWTLSYTTRSGIDFVGSFDNEKEARTKAFEALTDGASNVRFNRKHNACVSFTR